MSLITEYNLSFSDIENCTAPRKPRSVKPQQYVQAAEYERELLTRLPQIATATKHSTAKDGDNNDGDVASGLGIKGVGKLHSDSQESFKYNKTERRKRKKKKRRKHLKFSEDRYDNDDDIHGTCGSSLLPSIQSKQYTRENKANSLDKGGKTMTELADFFRSHQGNPNKIPQTTLQPTDHEEQKLQNSKKKADFLLAEAIEKDKNNQKQASRQLKQNVLRGKGMGHTCSHH